MRVIGRLLLVGFVTLVGVVPLAVSYTLATAVQLLATTVLIMGGTGHPLVSPNGSTLETPYASGYADTLLKNYIVPSKVAGEPYNLVAVYSPEEFFPVAGSMTFDDSVEAGRDNMNACVSGSTSCVSRPINTDGVTNPSPDEILIVGYSQSAVIASLVKRDLMADPDAPEDVPISFLLLANPMRPNGGILARGFEGLTIPIIGIKFYGAAPTNSCELGGPCYETVDVAQQYDLLGGDAPADVVNILAWANSLAAYVYLHGEVPNVPLDNAIPQVPYGDTTYYLIPAERLPLLMPLEPLVPGPILAVVDAPLRVLIEASYVRNVSPGEQVTFTLLPAADPITVGVNFVRAIPVGIDDGFQEAGFEERPLGTTPLDHPYGVGGEDESSVFDGTAITGGPASEEEFLASEVEEGDEVAETLTNRDTDGSEQEKAPDAAPSPTVRQLVRDSIRFDRPRPSADQPSGKRPSRIGQGLTRPGPRHTAGADGDEPTGGEPGASGGNQDVA